MRCCVIDLITLPINHESFIEQPASATTSISSAVFRSVIERRVLYIRQKWRVKNSGYSSMLRNKTNLSVRLQDKKKLVYTWVLE